jgi:hypothetical protein
VLKYLHIQPPPELFIREFLEGEEGIEPTGIKEWNDLVRFRLGLINDYLKTLYLGIDGDAAQECCTCFRWVWTTRATTAGQTVFFPPLPDCTLEDNEYQLVVVRSAHHYYNVDYTIDDALNTITLIPGLPLGGELTIYALRHNDIQEVYYETVAVPAVPYAYSPPVTVDRAGGRQLVFARNSARFLDSGRPGDEYTVSNTLNTLSLTAGLGPIGAMSALYRLMECGVLWHEEVLATVAEQTIYTPGNLENYVKPHDVGKMFVTQRTAILHPGLEFVTDVMANTITINPPGMAIAQPLNVWVFR